MRFYIVVAVLGALPALAQNNSTNARRLQGRNICQGTPADTNVLAWSASSNCWGPAAVLLAPANSITDNGTTIATNAALGNFFRVTALTANVTLSNPTNPTDGQVITWEVIQHASAAKTLAFGTAFRFGAEITTCTISSTTSSHNFITAVYNSTAVKWYVRGCITGY